MIRVGINAKIMVVDGSAEFPPINWRGKNYMS
jgi:hypothetical protein